MSKLSFDKFLTADHLQFIEEGQSVLTRLRAINKMGYDPSKSQTEMVPVGKKVQVELAEKITNPTLGGNPLLAIMNQGDDRFSGQKPRYGWLSAEIPVLAQMLAGTLGKSAAQWQEALNNLEVSTGMHPDEREVGKHIIEIYGLNPKLQGHQLHVQIQETTKQRDSRQQAKINPSSQEYILHQGKQIFTEATVVAGEPHNIFLAPDREDGTPASVPAFSLSKTAGEVFADED